MWAGYEEALTRYGLDMCDAWRSLGHGDTVADSLAGDELPTLARRYRVPPQPSVGAGA
ncbi:hypothetical protein HD601_006376 [Jiangella mangrovi]|uniref:Uncharacterized protein n=1 Tax=Jiangella mangrovi TaxID=1524084 RepID=A0A7W9LPZ8_9ACTN|nr:hypothetical protein [Jiangella mangrovi]